MELRDWNMLCQKPTNWNSCDWNMEPPWLEYGLSETCKLKRLWNMSWLKYGLWLKYGTSVTGIWSVRNLQTEMSNWNMPWPATEIRSAPRGSFHFLNWDREFSPAWKDVTPTNASTADCADTLYRYGKYFQCKSGAAKYLRKSLYNYRYKNGKSNHCCARHKYVSIHSFLLPLQLYSRIH